VTFPAPRYVPQIQPCGCGGPELTCLAHRCQRCRRPGWDGVILADTEDWEAPLCPACYEALGFA
jgi:hypothetical protein